MAYRYFASKTIYQIVATMETLFSVVILIFASKTVQVFHEQETDFQSDSQYLLYAGIVGIIVGVIQIVAAASLILSTRGGPAAFDKDDYAVSRIPTVWFFIAFLTTALLIFIFLGPLLQVDKKETLQKLKSPLTPFLTYVVANALCKLIFIWAMYTTIRIRRRR